jgi:hypothetical protein
VSHDIDPGEKRQADDVIGVVVSQRDLSEGFVRDRFSSVDHEGMAGGVCAAARKAAANPSPVALQMASRRLSFPIMN